MQYPAGSMASVGFLNLRYTGATAFSQLAPLPRRAINTGGTIQPTTAIPGGYSAGGAWLMPIKAGGMSSWQARFDVTGSGALIAGGPMAGNGDIGFSGDGSLSLTVALSGNGTLSVSGFAGLSLTIALSGDGGISISGLGSLSMIVPISGAASFGLTGAGALRGISSLEGSWGGAAPLSPEGLAAAVWGALAAQNNNPGTMGDLLNAAGGGGISGAVIDQIADAVWAWAETVTPGSKGDELAKALRAAKLAAALSA